MDIKSLQKENASSPRKTTLSGIEKLSKPQEENALSSILVTLFGIVTSIKLPQRSKSILFYYCNAFWYCNAFSGSYNKQMLHSQYW